MSTEYSCRGCEHANWDLTHDGDRSPARLVTWCTLAEKPDYRALMNWKDSVLDGTVKEPCIKRLPLTTPTDVAVALRDLMTVLDRL